MEGSNNFMVVVVVLSKLERHGHQRVASLICLAKGHKVTKTYSDISNGGGGEGSRCRRGVKPEASRSSAVPV